MRFKRFISFFFSSASRAVFRWQQHGISLHSDSFLVSFICLFYFLSSLYVRVNTSITCYAGYFAVHLLRKYTTMLGFLPLASSKILLLRSAAASLLLIFSLYARVKPNASFAVAWFPSSLQKSLLKVSLQKANKRVTTSVLFRAHTRNLSKYRSFRYSSAITGGTCRSLSPCDLGALLKSHLPSAFHPSLTARTFPQIRTVSASLSVGCSLKTSCKCTLFLTAFL